VNKNEIIEGIKNNNHDIISRLYLQYKKEFIRFAISRYQMDAATGKEIYQEAFTEFYRKIISGELTQIHHTIKTYLFKIGTNIISNELKKAKRTVKLENNSQKFYHNTSNEENDRKTIVEIVKNAMNDLSEKCRKLLTLYYFENKKYEELRYILNYKNIDSLKSQKYKCFKQLEQIVKNKYNMEDIL
jgi:RNA polymerase sigma factor (sigma-70 family)